MKKKLLLFLSYFLLVKSYILLNCKHCKFFTQHKKRLICKKFISVNSKIKILDEIPYDYVYEDFCIDIHQASNNETLCGSNKTYFKQRILK
jgi:hypothetical protein